MKIVVNPFSEYYFLQNWRRQEQHCEADRCAHRRPNVDCDDLRNRGPYGSCKKAENKPGVGERCRRMVAMLHRGIIIALPVVAGLLAMSPSWAGLGDIKSLTPQPTSRMVARRSVSLRPGYSVHDTILSDGSQIREFVSMGGLTFAVRWHAMHKPNMATLLGNSNEEFVRSMQLPNSSGGSRRNLRHDGSDLVVRSRSHLHVFYGLAYRESLMPSGLRPEQLE